MRIDLKTFITAVAASVVAYLFIEKVIKKPATEEGTNDETL